MLTCNTSKAVSSLEILMHFNAFWLSAIQRLYAFVYVYKAHNTGVLVITINVTFKIDSRMKCDLCLSWHHVDMQRKYMCIGIKINVSLF